LAVGTFLSFDYVRNGGTFFRPGLAGTKTPRGYQRVCCNCGPEGVCPNGLQRFERAVNHRLLASVPEQTAQHSRPSEASTVSTAHAQPARTETDLVVLNVLEPMREQEELASNEQTDPKIEALPLQIPGPGLTSRFSIMNLVPPALALLSTVGLMPPFAARCT